MEDYTEIRKITENLVNGDITHIERENVSIKIDVEENRLTISVKAITSYAMQLIDSVLDALYDVYEWELPVRVQEYDDEERAILLWGIGEIDLKDDTQYIFMLREGEIIGEYAHLYPRPAA